MLGLKLATDPRWANAAEKSIEEILIDHAYCEQKAATTGISLIVHYPEMEEMVKACTAVVAEEWGHFRKVLKELEKRGYSFGPQRKDIYVNELPEYLKSYTLENDKYLKIRRKYKIINDGIKYKELKCNDEIINLKKGYSAMIKTLNLINLKEYIKIYDLRKNKNRYDDIVFTIDRSNI